MTLLDRLSRWSARPWEPAPVPEVVANRLSEYEHRREERMAEYRRAWAKRWAAQDGPAIHSGLSMGHPVKAPVPTAVADVSVPAGDRPAGTNLVPFAKRV